MSGFVLTQAWLEGNGACSDASIFGDRYPQGALLTEENLTAALVAHYQSRDEHDGDLNLGWLVDKVDEVVGDHGDIDLMAVYRRPFGWRDRLISGLQEEFGFGYSEAWSMTRTTEATARYVEECASASADLARMMVEAFDQYPLRFAEFVAPTRTFVVTIERTEYSRATVEVEAEDEDDAKHEAARMLRNGEVDFDTYDWSNEDQRDWEVEEQ